MLAFLCVCVCVCSIDGGYKRVQLTESLGHRTEGLAVAVEVTLCQHRCHQCQDGSQGVVLLAPVTPGAAGVLEGAHAALQLNEALLDASGLQDSAHG